LAFNILHGIISPKIVFFITTAVRASNPTCRWLLADASVSWKRVKAIIGANYCDFHFHPEIGKSSNETHFVAGWELQY
jgi:hypothetical protein